MKNKIRRWFHKARTWPNHGDMINRSVEVQNKLLGYASRCEPMPPEECKKLAVKLGTLTGWYVNKTNMRK